MTDARLGGLGREALVADAGQVRLGGVVREALVAGIGLSGTITARARGRSNASVVFGGVILSASAKAQSRARTAPLSVHINLAGRVKARSSIRASLPSAKALAGRISARSSARLVRNIESIWDGGASIWDGGASRWDLPTVFAARATATSGGGGAITTGPQVPTRQYAVSIINS